MLRNVEEGLSFKAQNDDGGGVTVAVLKSKNKTKVFPVKVGDSKFLQQCHPRQCADLPCIG